MNSSGKSICSATATEMKVADGWTAARLGGAEPPFSFRYGGQSSADLIGGWKRSETVSKLDACRTRRVATYTDARTGLAVRCVAVTYRDFPVVEWTVHFKNTGKSNTPIIEQIQAADLRLNRVDLAEGSPASQLTLHYHIGSPTRPEDYRPLVAELKPGDGKAIATSGGRPCNAHMPFFNLEWQGCGVILAIGWPGQWAADFRHEKDGALRLSAGQELTHFTLHPGEKVRTPLIALLFYQGDRIRSQNLWRRWMIGHNLPRPHGKLPAPMLCATGWLYFAPWGTSNAQSLKIFIDTYEARKLPIDACWIDAGWYDCDASLGSIGYSVWNRTGTWEPDRRRFPNGVREVNDHAHQKGLKTILWFEPERVWHPGSWLADRHPEWLLKAAPNPAHMAVDQNTRLLDLGNPAALRWLINHVSGLLKRERVDIYREDFNMDPLAFWRANDARDRRGITEIRHVMGHLAFWDELRRRHPNLLIDCVSSGSKRIELEAFRRAVTLWRSDYACGFTWNEPNTVRLAASQCIIHGISSWIPYHGLGVNHIDAYRFRSFMSPSLVFDLDPRRDDLDVDLWRRLMAQFKQVAPYYFGDYYPLTPYRLEPDVWMAWQFDRPEKGEGMVQAFRREKSRQTTARFRLHGLRAESVYMVTDLDSGKTQRRTGRALMANGLRVTAPTKPTAMVFLYQRVTNRK